MKVLLIDQIAKVNYKYTYPLANGLAKQGIDVCLVIDQKEEDENCKLEKIRFFNTSEKNIGKINKLVNYLASYCKVCKILKSGEYKVLHTEWYTFSPLDYFFIKKIKCKYNIRYVATVHDILPFNCKFYDKFFHEKIYTLADAIILQAPSNVDRFNRLFQMEKSKEHMIPHGHMLDYVDIQEKILSRKKMDIPKNKTVFLFFGQIKKVKGVDILLKAFEKVRSEFPDAFLVIAGNVWKSDFTECEKIIKEYSLEDCIKTDIRFIPDEDVKFYYSAADICVLPYTDVYQSGVIQLVYGYKKPAIATKLPAFTQFVIEGETGFLAEPGDEISLAEAMERAMERKNSFDVLGECGYNMVKKELNWDDLAKRIVEECY